LRSIRYIGKSLVVLRLGKLLNLEGLTGIRLTGGLEIRENNALQNLKGLDSLRALTGLLQLVKNQALTDLSALKNIISIKGRLEIVDNATLETLAGLESIDYTTIEFMTITGCTKLNYCAVPSICNYLNFGRNAEIRQNAIGCNNKPEVIAANPHCTPNFTSKAKNLWQTEQGRWLLALLAVTIVGALAAWYFYRKFQRSQFMQLRTTLAQDLHDDFGSEMSSIALASYAAAKSGDIVRMSAVLEQISRQSEQMVEDMRDIVWSIHPENDTMEKMVGRMKIYTNQLFGEQEIVTNFDVSVEALRIKVDINARKQLYLLFKEAMNNAAKYAQCRSVTISIYKKDKQFILVISDDGQGFDLTSTPMGNGIRNMRSRAAAFNGTLDILTSPGKGTTIRLSATLK
jgi:signal transduction histidine kinase